MSFSPRLLLSIAARERCIAGLKRLPTLAQPTCYTNTEPIAAVLVPLCVHRGEVCLIYTLRSSHLKTHGGEISFPGGKMDAEETVYDAALRETNEEIGINPKDVDIWGKMSLVQMKLESAETLSPVVGFVNNFDENKLKINTDEVEDVFKISIKDLCRKEIHAYFNLQNAKMPIYIYRNYKIWGTTGLITYHFLNCILDKSVYKHDFRSKQYTFDDLLLSK